jgi:hypothetical protein
MRSALKPPRGEARPNVPGAAMHVLVLAPSQRLTYGVDLGSGAFVRMHHAAPTHRDTAPRYGDVAIGQIGEDPDAAAGAQPSEDTMLQVPLRRVGHMTPRQIDKTLAPLHHRTGRPLFGCEGPALPMWAVDQTTSGVSLIEPESDLAVTVTDQGTAVRFRWRAYTYQLPVDDSRVNKRLDWLPDSPVGGRALAHVMGFYPRRLLLALSEPSNGYCYKTAVALLR